MKSLGCASHGARRLAERACVAVVQGGEVAVFLSRATRKAAAVAYTDRQYARAMRRHAPSLVGVYRDDLADNDGLQDRIVDDLIAHARSGRAVSA